jgi:hypothetical protein
MHYGRNSWTLFRVDPSDGSILSTCNIQTQNPSHPAVTNFPRNIGEWPDGLDWTGTTLWASSEVFAYNWVVELDTQCNILQAYRPPLTGDDWGTSGIAVYDTVLWHSNAHLYQFETNLAGTQTGNAFSNVDLQHEDLACDDASFAPTSVLWANEANTISPNRITAYENAACGLSSITVDIDIKPSSDPNSINTKSMGSIPVAILGSDVFDVQTVDISTLTFGPAGAMPVHTLSDPSMYAKHLEDVNLDGYPDLVSHYQQKMTGLAVDDTEACVSGNTTDGTPIGGCDAVRVVM